MDRLSSIGSKINRAVKKAKDNWKTMIKYDANTPSILMLYGKFLVHVLNEKGTELIKKSKRLAEKQLEIKKEVEDDFSNLLDPVPMILVGSSKNEPGYIKKVNTYFCSTFGHYHEDITDNKKINMLMPGFWADIHDSYLARFMDCSLE